jgi:hypothetical protein
MAGAPVPRTIAPDTVGRRRRRAQASTRAAHSARHVAPASVPSQSLLDIVDSLIDKGVALDTEVVLGLADIDLVYLRAGLLIAAADRVFPKQPANRRRVREGRATRHPSSQTTPLAAPRAQASAALVTRLDAQGAAPVPTPIAPDDTSRSVIRLVLTLVEFVRQLLERQAVRRVRKRTLTPEEIERLGTALMRLESTVHELAERHGLDPADLNLDLGPLGTLR